MAATDTYTWDVLPEDGGARRASLEDFGGATVENDDPNPDKGREVYDDMMNELQRHAAGVSKMIESCSIGIHISDAGVPSVDLLQAMGTLIDSETFTVTDEGDGIVLIEWTRGLLPTRVLKPRVSLDTDGWWAPPVAVLVSDVTEAGLDGVRVKTRDGATGDLIDCDFTVDLR